MTIHGVGALGGAHLWLRPRGDALRLDPRGASAGGSGLVDFTRQVLALGRRIERLRLEGGTRFGAGVSRPAVVRSKVLGLDDFDTPTTLRSTEEINTVPTSYSTHEPSFDGASSAAPVIGGIYDGDQGDDTLTFEVSKGGVIGLDNARIDVYDGTGARIDRINTGGNAPAGTVYYLSNGLTLSFAGGLLVKNDTFELDVRTSVGTSVDPEDPFDGTGDADPEFDPGLGVGAGSFDVNGVAIAVLANDTLESVLDRITASDAGVTATFDPITEGVELRQKTTGPGVSIVVGNDSSGFLAASKLLDAVPALGTEGDAPNVAIDQVANLSGIRSGFFSINGESIAVDVSIDSLLDVVARINAADVGARATYDSATDRVTLRGEKGKDLVLADGGADFFTGLGIDPGVYRGEERPGRTRFTNGIALSEGLEGVVESLNEILAVELTGVGSATVAGIRAKLEQAVGRAVADHLGLEGDGTLRTGLGLDLLRADEEGLRPRFDRGDFRSALRRSPRDLSALLFADADDPAGPGLVAGIERVLQEAASSLEPLLLEGERVGLRLDLLA